jgi:hypothetical protein
MLLKSLKYNLPPLTYFASFYTNNHKKHPSIDVKNGWVGGGRESVKYTFPQQMRIRSDYGSGFKSKSVI